MVFLPVDGIQVLIGAEVEYRNFADVPNDVTAMPNRL